MEKSIKRAVEKVRALTVHTGTCQETTELVGKMNRTLRGWANYFSLGRVIPRIARSMPTRSVRLRRWLRAKQKVKRRRGGTYPLSHLFEHFGLVRMTNLARGGSWAKA